MLLAQCEEEGYGDTLAACAGDPYAGLSTAQDVDLYTRRLTYGFSQVGEGRAGPQVAGRRGGPADHGLPGPHRGAAHTGPGADRDGLRVPARPHRGRPRASWQRINLAAAMAADVVVGADGSVTVTNFADATRASVADAGSITVGGVAIDGFDPEVSTYVVDWPRNKRIPAVSAVPARSGARVKVTDGGSVLSSAGSRFTTRTVTVTSANGSVTRTYTVGFRLTARDDRPVTAGGGDRETGGPGSWSTGGGGAGPPTAPGSGRRRRSGRSAWASPGRTARRDRPANRARKPGQAPDARRVYAVRRAPPEEPPLFFRRGQPHAYAVTAQVAPGGSESDGLAEQQDGGTALGKVPR